MMLDLYFSLQIINYYQYTQNINPVLNFVLVKNTGAAFSILENCKLFLISFAFISIALILFYIVKYIEKLSLFFIFWSSLIIAGIGCNLYERVYYGYVRDFFKLNFVNFPIFNISDIFINIGVCAILIIIISNRCTVKNHENNH